MKKELPKLTPSRAGTILFQVNEYRLNKIEATAKEAIELANYVIALCKEFSLTYDETKIKEYATDKEALIKQYISNVTAECKTLPELLSNLLKSEARKAIESRCGDWKDCDISAFEFLEWNAKKDCFELNHEAASNSCRRYLNEEETEVYDRHRIIAALLTDFLGGSITHISHLAEYFDLQPDGTIIPSFGTMFTEYPPKGKNDNEGRTN